MFDNSGFFIFLEQSPNGRVALQNIYDWSDSQIDYLNEKGSGVGLIYNNSVLVPFNFRIPNTSKMYELLSTNPNDKDKVN